MGDHDEFDMERARRSEFDNPGIHRRRRRPHTNWLAISTALFAVVFQVGTLLYYGGRLTQRVDTLEALLMEQRQREASLSDDNSRQNVSLGAIGQQYVDISRRLESIERKLDSR
jgi:hypothetical protein